jgi:hypothetical protein
LFFRSLFESFACINQKRICREDCGSFIPVAQAWYGTEVVGPMEYLDQDIDLPSLTQDRSSGERKPSYHLCSSKQELLPLYFPG